MYELYNECSYVLCVVDECDDIIIWNVYEHCTDEDVFDMLQEHPEWSVKCKPEFI